MSMIEVNDVTFLEGVRKEGMTLVDFGAPWCPPCKNLLPILEELGSDYGEKLTILKVNCDESTRLTSEYAIMSMPTVILFQNGEPVDKIVGLRPKSVYQTALSRYS